jgi:hypothetical protein
VNPCAVDGGGYRRACGLESFELPIKLNEAVLPSLDLLVQAREREVPLATKVIKLASSCSVCRQRRQ